MVNMIYEKRDRMNGEKIKKRYRKIKGKEGRN